MAHREGCRLEGVRFGGHVGFELSGGSIALDQPDRLTEVTSWHSHIPFAFWCVEALRPRVIVELGTHRGDSYCAFCQAVDRLSLPAQCYAIDTWKGDAHAGFYGEDVLSELSRYHDPRFGKFSRLVRATFDEAAPHFAEGMIDLLHIDGLHTYEAIRHDFETWLPKLSRAAVVLFHDTNVRDADFSVWRFWEQVSVRYPHFEFLHGHGLGVLVVGKDAPEPLRRLASSGPDDVSQARALFERLGAAVSTSSALARARDDLGQSEARAARAEEQRRAEVTAHVAEQRRLKDELSRCDSRLKEIERSRTWRMARALASGTRLPRRLAHALRVLSQILYWTVTLQLHTGLRRRKYARLIRRSGLFQAEYYLSQVADPERVGRDPIWHFLVEGASAGLDPNPLFDTSYYVEQNRTAASGGKNPLVHYIRNGAGDGARSGPLFDTAFYLSRYPDVAASGMNPLRHYLATGAAEGRICLPGALAPPRVVRHARAQPLENPRALSDALFDRAGSLLLPRTSHVLVVDHRIPTPDHDAGSVRMFAIVKILQELGHEVAFVSDSTARDPRNEQELCDLGIVVLHGFDATSTHLALEGHRYRFVLLSRPEIVHRYLPIVRAHAIHADVVYDTVDLHWVRLEREAALTNDATLHAEAQRFRAIERLGVACSDLVLAVTALEKEALVAEVSGARVEIIPTIHGCRPSSRPWEDRSGLMFIGGFEHRPNVDAMKWFVAEVLPLVHRQLPEMTLHIIGSKTPESVRRLASTSVQVAGYVPDPRPFFERTRVFVAPLRYGAGMKGKIGHAMSQGLPVVTTSIGAEGMTLIHGEHALIADDAEAFAAAVVRLHGDKMLWSKLARTSLRHVEEHFSHEVVRTKLASLFPARSSIGTLAHGEPPARCGGHS